MANLLSKYLIKVLFSIFIAQTANAVPLYVFSSPDAGPTSTPGDGLQGSIWTNADVVNLAEARIFASASTPEATFTSTSVDYPNGPECCASVSVDFSTFLGVDAPSISDPTVANTAISGSILRFEGYLGVTSPGSVFLGLASDDGSELLVQGAQVIDNDGAHTFPGPGAGPVEILFTAAGRYRIELLYFETFPGGAGIEFFADNRGNPVAQAHLYTAVPIPAALPLLLGAFGLMLAAVRGGVRSNPRISSLPPA